MSKKSKKTFTWTIEVEVDRVWIEDGFDLDDEKATDIFLGALSMAYEGEVKARILARPPRSALLRAQGYTDVQIDVTMEEK